ncbi:MAG TPA: hypothetical protein VLA60_00775 [Nitrospirales bacterium]|nr:hypothetical protein [Nitrospirales bacterium]
MTTFESRQRVTQHAEVITGMPPGYEGLGEYSRRCRFLSRGLLTTVFPAPLAQAIADSMGPVLT